MNALWYDLRQALRLPLRRPALTTAAVVSLALGIGATTAIFSLVKTILLDPLPYPDSHELVEAFRVDENVTGLNPTIQRVSGLWAVPYEVQGDWIELARVFESAGGYAGTGVRLPEGEGESSVQGAFMSAGAFQALGVEAEMGRTFLPEEDEVGAPPVAVLGYGLWQSRFGGDPRILGTPIDLNGTAHTVVGIMPRDFAFPSDTYRMWISFPDERKTSPVRNGGYMKVVARLKTGITLEEARRDMDRVAGLIGEVHPEESEHGIGLFPQKAMIVGDNGRGLLVLLGAVVLVLLIACTNIAGFFLVRATERRREIGVRRAMGAGTDRLVFQQMSECLLLSILGGAAGWGLAVIGLEPALSLMPAELPRVEELRIDEGLLLTSMGFALLTGLLTGLLPAIRAAKTPITSVLQEGGRSLSGSRSRNRVQTLLVVSQVAIAFVLLSGAGLFVRSMTGLLKVDPGFNSNHLALANVSFPDGIDDWDGAMDYFRTLEDRIRAMPGVVGVGAADQMPFAGGWSSPPVTMETAEGVRDGVLHCPTVTPSYFEAMEIPILAGRPFSMDDNADSNPVVVVSQALAESLTPEGSPLGLRIRMNAPGDSIWRTVVGVAADVRYRLDWGPMMMAYFPAPQSPTYLDNWVIRTAGNPTALSGSFQRLREELDPEGTSSYRPLKEAIEGSTVVVATRFSVLLLGSLAGLAALLAVFGVYGILAYLVQLRSREIGIQLALGAENRRVLATVLRRGVLMGGAGLGMGFLASLGLGKIIESQLFGVAPWDPPALMAAGALLLGSTLLASFLPARRASRLDPVEILKGD
jgi:putative ABC transport system permease protein